MRTIFKLAHVVDQNGQQIILRDNGLSGDITANDGIVSLTWRPSVAGTYVLNFGSGDSLSVIVNKPNVGIGTYKADDTVSYEYENILGQALKAGDDTLHMINIPFQYTSRTILRAIQRFVCKFKRLYKL